MERGGISRRLVCGESLGCPGRAALPGAGGVRLLLPVGVLPGAPADLRPPGAGHPQVITPPARQQRSLLAALCRSMEKLPVQKTWRSQQLPCLQFRYKTVCLFEISTHTKTGKGWNIL